MRKLLSIVIITAIVLLSSCIKNHLTVWTGAQVELDAATWNSNAVGLVYPIVKRVPAYGAAVNANNSPTLLTRTTASFQLRVNLVGPQQSQDIPITYRVSPEPTNTAVQGVHYAALSGTGVIPKNSSFGYITITPLNPGATSGSVVLVIELLNSTVKVNPNYNKVGLSIAQN